MNAERINSCGTVLIGTNFKTVTEFLKRQNTNCCNKASL